MNDQKNTAFKLGMISLQNLASLSTASQIPSKIDSGKQKSKSNVRKKRTKQEIVIKIIDYLLKTT